MSPVTKTALDQLDELIELWEKVPFDGSHKYDYELQVRMLAAIQRFAPRSSVYFQSTSKVGLGSIGKVAKALRSDYAKGYLSEISEIIHADVFSDFIEAAEHLLEQGFKDPAAVMIGGVLENHLRQLCTKNGIVIEMAKNNGGTESKKSETLNTELRTLGVYDANRQKQVTSMLALRNSAAHAKYNDHDQARIVLYAAEVRNFISSFPA